MVTSNVPSKEDELSDVLADFYQRVLAEKRETRPRDPMLIQVTQQTFHSRTPELPTRRQEKLSNHQQGGLVGVEDEYDLVDAGFNLIGTNFWDQVIHFSGHNPGRVTQHPLFIRVFNSQFSILAPGITPPSGILNVLFNQSTWTPPPLPDFVANNCTLRCHDPQPTGPPGDYLITLTMQFAIQDSVTGLFASEIFGTWPQVPGNPALVQYTQATNFHI